MNPPYKPGLVSVVTPVYNGEAFLGKMLDSLLSQGYPYIELILVDDGSSDRTLQVAERFRERFAAKGYGYRVLSREHKNASAAISAGLPYVTGEYLIWPDSDDVLEPESVAKRVDFLQTHPEYQCVRSLSYYYDGETGVRAPPDERRGDLYSEELFWDVLEGRSFVCCGCYMLRSAAFFSIYPERHIPEYDVGQNFQMLLPFLYRHKCPTIPEELYGVTVRRGSHSRTRLNQAQEEKKYDDYERLIDEIAGICQITSPEEKNRIDRWKTKRRYQISLKHGHKKEAARALRWLCRYGGLSGFAFLKLIVWSVFFDNRFGRKLYSLYERLCLAFQRHRTAKGPR